MLDSVCLNGVRIDVEDIAEALVYYRQVNLLANSGGLIKIASQLGGDNLRRLVEGGYAKLNVCQHDSGVYGGDSELFGTLVHFRMGRERQDLFSVMAESVRNPNRVEKIDRNTIRFICDNVVDLGFPKNVIPQAMADANDVQFSESVVRIALKYFVPDYLLPPAFYAHFVVDGTNRVAVKTNLDYSKITESYNRNYPSPTPERITQSHLIQALASPHNLMFQAGGTGSDIWSDEFSSSLLKNKVNSYEKHLNHSKKDIGYFEDIIFDGRSFGGTLKAGQKSISELIDFLENPETVKFREMIHHAPADSRLIQEYDKALLAESKLTGSLGYKTIKLSVFTGVSMVAGGLLSPLLSKGVEAAISAVDEFGLSKVNLDWKPNQWVDKAAKPFLGI